jgi:hypothetical protein
MRTLAFAFGEPGEGPSAAPLITEIARIDVDKHPVSGLRPGELIAYRYPPSADEKSFRDLRLAQAIWTPKPPDVLVSALPDTLAAIPPELCVGLPCIFVLNAWRHVLKTAPSKLLGLCWERGGSLKSREHGGTPPEREAMFVSVLLALLVEQASLEELVAMSRA